MWKTRWTTCPFYNPVGGCFPGRAGRTLLGDFQAIGVALFLRALRAQSDAAIARRHSGRVRHGQVLHRPLLAQSRTYGQDERPCDAHRPTGKPLLHDGARWKETIQEDAVLDHERTRRDLPPIRIQSFSKSASTRRTSTTYRIGRKWMNRTRQSDAAHTYYAKR